MLQVDNLHCYYGHIHALRGVCLRVEAGEIVAIIGANGAGKSTLLRTIAGVMRPRHGTVHLLRHNITGVPAYDIARRGLALVPEGRRVFVNLTVQENLEVGGITCHTAERWHRIAEMCGMFPRLAERAHQQASNLSGGEQQMLAIARALMSSPRLLLLDEPSMGLAPNIVDQVRDLLVRVHSQGTTVLLVEQNARMALAVAQRAYVLEIGRVVLEGASTELAHNPEVKAAYLGH